MTGLIDFLGRLQSKDITLLLLTALSVQPLMLPEAWQPTWFSSNLQSVTVFRPPGCFGRMSEVVAHHTAFQSPRTELNVASELFIYSYMHICIHRLCVHIMYTPDCRNMWAAILLTAKWSQTSSRVKVFGASNVIFAQNHQISSHSDAFVFKHTQKINIHNWQPCCYCTIIVCMFPCDGYTFLK